MKLNYLKFIAINCTIHPILKSINFWFLFFVFQFHICLPNYGFGNMLYSPPKIKVSSKFRYLLLSSKKFLWNFKKKTNTNILWSEYFGLLGVKSVHGRPNCPSWYHSWPYIAPPEPHCQLPSLLVHWPFRERNTHAIL